MRQLILILALAGPVAAQEPAEAPALIDATKLSVAELMALAAAEREAQDALGCCDWGGLGCVPDTARTGS
ncbi:MAG: hypothetical protein OXQ92_04965 [Boseongicola sp.]|nr:hypothetical protein [Boseongicola sp.]MDD9977409.1 hypothetical protein [Boseongicola sp.]